MVLEVVKLDTTNKVSVGKVEVQGLSPPTLGYLEVVEMKKIIVKETKEWTVK